MENTPNWKIPANHFEKWQACGNDFILMSEPIPGLKERRLCDRNFSIGGDGVIYLLPSEVADVRMSIINADGTEAEMCGNGIRCVGQYMAGKLNRNTVTVETLAGIKELKIDGIDVSVDMGNVIPLWSSLIHLPGRMYDAAHLDIGNPHCVLLIDNLEDGEVEKYGSMLENMIDIFPTKTNVEFAEVCGRKRMHVKVWERGCGRTLGCGTGACAAAVVANDRGLVDDIVTVILEGGEVEVTVNGPHAQLAGPAEFVFKGTIYPPED